VRLTVPSSNRRKALPIVPSWITARQQTHCQAGEGGGRGPSSSLAIVSMPLGHAMAGSMANWEGLRLSPSTPWPCLRDGLIQPHARQGACNCPAADALDDPLRPCPALMQSPTPRRPCHGPGSGAYGPGGQRRRRAAPSGWPVAIASHSPWNRQELKLEVTPTLSFHSARPWCWASAQIRASAVQETGLKSAATTNG